MPNRILILGAGKSATCLINYLAQACTENNWHLVVADSNPATQSKVPQSPNIQAASVNIENPDERGLLINQADLVIALLPPPLLLPVALDCIRFKKHLLTASYLDDKLRGLSADIASNGLLFLCEMGLDPGIDHMSAMKWIDNINMNGGTITSFISHCGGLVAPESDDNPWHYKISWNPRNIVLAGSLGAVYVENNELREIGYYNLFKQCKEVAIEPLGRLAYYPNRDSQHYQAAYQLQQAHTFLRTTLRHPAFCTAWHAVVNAGLTSPATLTHKPATFKDWSKPVVQYLTEQNKEQLHYLGLFDDQSIPPPLNSSADIIQHLFETKLAMRPHDKDMIVMLHQIEYLLHGQKHHVESSLIVKGENMLETAMAKTVGLPLGIAAKLILQNKIQLRGLHIPVLPEIYQPVLEELAELGIVFRDVV